MRRKRTWTTGDLKRVAELAGTMPERELRRRMKISKSSFEYALRQLRSMGREVDARFYEPRLPLCPECGCRRATVDGSGLCEPCRLRRQLAQIERRAAALMPRLTPGQRAVYERTEAERESRAGAMPRSPATDGLDAYARAEAMEAYDAEMERWLIGYLGRRVKAAQKRKERIQRKADSNNKEE